MPMHSDVRLMVGHMLVELMTGPATHAELVEASGFADSTVREWLRDLRKAGAVRVCAWDRIRGGQVVKPVYELNVESKPEVKRPKANASSMRSARYRLRQRLRRQGTDPAIAEQIVASQFPLRY